MDEYLQLLTSEHQQTFQEGGSKVLPHIFGGGEFGMMKGNSQICLEQQTYWIGHVTLLCLKSGYQSGRSLGGTSWFGPQNDSKLISMI